MINHNKDHRHNNEVLGTILSQNLQKTRRGDCPSPEEIAALVERNIYGAERNQIMKHVSGCEKCYEIFILSSNLKYKPQIKKSLAYRPLALAASVLIVIFSLFILYKSGLINTKSVPLSEKEESEIRRTKPLHTDYFRKKDDSAGEHMKKGAKAITPAKRERKKEKRKRWGRDESKGYYVSKKSKNQGKLKPELPGTQKQTEVPFPQSPKLDSKAKKTGQKAQIEIQQKTTVLTKPEAAKNLVVQAEPRQIEENIQEFKSQEEIESDKTLGLSTVVSLHANGNKKLVKNYTLRGGKRTLKEIVEYDQAGRIISIQNLTSNSLNKYGYYPNGNKKFREEYKDGKPHGNWIGWNQKGEIVTNLIYKKGKLEKKIK